jgi:thymidylate kinase
MFIIIDGCDATYKTTLANKLAKKLNFPVIKGSSFELSKCNNKQLFDHFLKLAELDNVVIDRFIYSNLVYASLYSGYAILNQNQFDEIENLIKNKVLLIYLTSDAETIKNRLKSRGDNYVNEDMIEKILNKYAEVMSKSSLIIHTYDTKSWDSDMIVEDLMKRIEC